MCIGSRNWFFAVVLLFAACGGGGGDVNADQGGPGPTNSIVWSLAAELPAPGLLPGERLMAPDDMAVDGPNRLVYVAGSVALPGTVGTRHMLLQVDFSGPVPVTRKIDGNFPSELFCAQQQCPMSVDGLGHLHISLMPYLGQATLVTIDRTGNVLRTIPTGKTVTALTADAAGNVFYAEYGYLFGEVNVHKVALDGTDTLLAGEAVIPRTGSRDLDPPRDGTGADARFAYILDLAVGVDGNLYAADFRAGTIRKITAAGVVTTVANIGVPARPSQPGFIPGPVAVTSAADGRLFAAGSDCTVREFSAQGTVTPRPAQQDQQDQPCPWKLGFIGQRMFTADSRTDASNLDFHAWQLWSLQNP
jgi:hypothetical protein